MMLKVATILAHTENSTHLRHRVVYTVYYVMHSHNYMYIIYVYAMQCTY